MLLSPGEAKKKKKKKKKPKKKGAKTAQSDPPRVGLSKFFPSGNYPVGEEQEYKDEYACLPTLNSKVLNDLGCNPAIATVPPQRRSGTMKGWLWKILN